MCIYDMMQHDIFRNDSVEHNIYIYIYITVLIKYNVYIAVLNKISKDMTCLSSLSMCV